MKTAFAAAALLALSMSAAQGQSAPKQQSTPAVDLSAVRASLRSLVGAQETHFVNAGRYSLDVTALSLTLGDSVSIRLTDASNNAYVAIGTLKGVEGASCVVAIGRVSAMPKTAQGKVATAEGAVACDGDK